VARQYGKLANNRFWDTPFPGLHVDPAIFFGLDQGGTGIMIQDTWQVGLAIRPEKKKLPPRILY
jgi:hypothetical protein